MYDFTEVGVLSLYYQEYTLFIFGFFIQTYLHLLSSRFLMFLCADDSE